MYHTRDEKKGQGINRSRLLEKSQGERGQGKAADFDLGADGGRD